MTQNPHTCRRQQSSRNFVRPQPTRALTLACAAWLIAGCTEPSADPVEPAPAFPGLPGEPGDAANRTLYQVRLGAQGGTHSHGVMRIEIVGGYLAVTVHATNLAPGQSIPQHIHVNPTCSPGGAALINLDAGLTVRLEAPGTGAAYPMSNEAGVVNYYATRSLSDLLNAVNTYLGAGLASVDALVSCADVEYQIHALASARRCASGYRTPIQ